MLVIMSSGRGRAHEDNDAKCSTAFLSASRCRSAVLDEQLLVGSFPSASSRTSGQTEGQMDFVRRSCLPVASNVLLLIAAGSADAGDVRVPDGKRSQH